MNAPVIGIDLDNTLISYDKLFHALALEQGLIARDLPVNKTEVRDFLRRVGKEPAWTALQGLAYGARIREAEIFEGALDFLREGARRGWEMHIVSHKTRAPIVGEPVDLHEAARGWLEVKAVHGEMGLPRENVWLEVTKAAKISRIRELGCDVFIDDLPELLLDAEFPAGTRRILFAPQGAGVKEMPADVAVARSWAEITRLLAHEFN
jgi:FMN phosphatase YigB (HAD superfamily)